MMGIVDRFESLVTRAPAVVPLDECALLIAVAARGEDAVDVERALQQLDVLAAGCDAPTFDALRRHLFERERFRGNTASYEDPDNSFLDRVLDRRLGIPITLSTVMIETGRRAGVPVLGVGMPGHFIVRAADDPQLFCDPFGGGRLLDEQGCAQLLATVTRGGVQFDRALLAPISSTRVLARMLTNLEHGPFGADPLRLSTLVELHQTIPDLGPQERLALASRLAALGRFGDAAEVVDPAAGAAGTDAAATDGTALRQHARAFRARLN
jgi:regulator of sirC expression with transglutaminase-like and TPR domain